jgi:hypothetical protein
MIIYTVNYLMFPSNFFNPLNIQMYMYAQYHLNPTHPPFCHLVKQ